MYDQLLFANNIVKFNLSDQVNQPGSFPQVVSNPSNLELVVTAGSSATLNINAVRQSDIGPHPGPAPQWTTAGVNIFDLDPLFFNPSVGNYRLQSGSPCLDVGDDGLLPFDYLDLDKNGLFVIEKIPVDLDGGIGTALSPRESFQPTAVTTSGIMGSDIGGNIASAICDIGCNEKAHLDL